MAVVAKPPPLSGGFTRWRQGFIYIDFLTRGDLRSPRGWPCQRGRSKFKCDTNVHCVNDKQYMKYNHLTNRKISFLQL